MYTGGLLNVLPHLSVCTFPHDLGELSDWIAKYRPPCFILTMCDVFVPHRVDYAMYPMRRPVAIAPAPGDYIGGQRTAILSNIAEFDFAINKMLT